MICVVGPYTCESNSDKKFSGDLNFVTACRKKWEWNGGLESALLALYMYLICLHMDNKYCGIDGLLSVADQEI